MNGDTGQPSERPYPTAIVLPVLLPCLHLVGCLAGGRQMLMSVFCVAGPLGPVPLAVWLVLAASLPLGFVAMFVTQMRPIYWTLLALSVVGLAVQPALVSAGVLRCISI